MLDTVLDYVHNLAASGAIGAKHVRAYDNHSSLVRGLIDRDGTAAERKQMRTGDNVDKAVTNALFTMIERRRHRRCTPSQPREPVLSNLRMMAKVLGLNDTELAVLQFVLACCRTDLQATLNPISCDGTSGPGPIIAAALGVSPRDVEAALDGKGRLLTTGLFIRRASVDLEHQIELDQRVLQLANLPILDEARFVEEFLPHAPTSTLAIDDFGHLHTEVMTARKLLAAALDSSRAGINLLLHGPTGTGKSELARFLCDQLNARLFVAGQQNRDGESPDARQRLTSLSLGNKLLARGRHVLLFDELEDLFESSALAQLLGGRTGMDKRLMSKQWFNLLLEDNPVPTIWISNRISGVDPAFLRRFSYIIELGNFTARQRKRAWVKHLGGEDVLPVQDLDLLAQRFEVSPAHIGTAVTAARLVTGGAPDRAALETILKPAERVLNGRTVPVPVFHAERYLPELVNTPTDLATVERRIVAWRSGDGPGLSLCLYGPPGTGKSEFVRYLAHRADRPLLVKRASDLISMWVGQTEELIAAAFEEARRDEAVLLFDEADSFLQDRRGASRSWEITQVNEFLQQLEVFPGVVACTTNLMDTLDQAALRRFVFKIPFKFLRPEQSMLAFRSLMLELGIEGDAPSRISRIGNLAPGDFAAVARRLRGSESRATPDELLGELEAEVHVKEKGSGRVGF